MNLEDKIIDQVFMTLKEKGIDISRLLTCDENAALSGEIADIIYNHNKGE